MKRAPTRKRDALLRGLTKRCPHCGVGPLFVKGAALHPHCSACDLKFQLNSGDPWAFLLFIDRAAVVFPIVVAVYFGLFKLGLPVFLAFTASLVGLFVLTTPNRYGFCVALDYLTRVDWGDRSVGRPAGPASRQEANDGGVVRDVASRRLRVFDGRIGGLLGPVRPFRSEPNHPENLIRPEKLCLQNERIEITMGFVKFFDSVLRTLRFGTWVKA